MISIIDKYLEDLENCFFICKNGYDKIAINNLLNDKAALTAGISEKENYRENWNLLIDSLKEKPYLRIRDMEIFGQRHSFNGLASFDFDKIGLIFSINFPLKLIAFRYAKFKKRADMKIVEEILSYMEVDEKSKIIKDEIAHLVNFYFPKFETFNNNYADYKIKSIIIDGIYYSEIDLWQSLFSTNNHGIL